MAQRDGEFVGLHVRLPVEAAATVAHALSGLRIAGMTIETERLGPEAQQDVVYNPDKVSLVDDIATGNKVWALTFDQMLHQATSTDLGTHEKGRLTRLTNALARAAEASWLVAPGMYESYRSAMVFKEVQGDSRERVVGIRVERAPGLADNLAKFGVHGLQTRSHDVFRDYCSDLTV